MTDKQIKYITNGASIATMYVVLTYFSSIMGLASGAIQIRLSEGLVAMLYLTPAAIPGLTIGCLLANILTGCCLLDCAFGTFATFIGAYLGFMLRKKAKWLIPLPTVISNSIIVPFVLIYGYGINSPYYVLASSVCFGEIISAGVVGLIILGAILHIGYKMEK